MRLLAQLRDFEASGTLLQARGLVRQWCEQRGLQCGEVSALHRLSGGMINHVWRVESACGDLILKIADEQVSSVGEVQLSPQRLVFEVRALNALRNSGFLLEVLRGLNHIQGADVWDVYAPMVYIEDVHDHALVQEYRSGGVGFEDWARVSEGKVEGLCEVLGYVVGRMHGASFVKGMSAWCGDMLNMSVQRVRQEVQYRGVRRWLEAESCAADVIDEVSQASEALGDVFAGRDGGVCFVMGDLWPGSILVQEEARTLSWIDWEFAHWGYPGQDVGHWLAHLWLCGDKIENGARGDEFKRASRVFLEGYTRGLAHDDAVFLSEGEYARQGVIHYGVEILARALGPFQTDPAHWSVRKKERALSLVVSIIRDARLCKSRESSYYCLLK